MCEFMFRMFYAYKNGESTVHHNDGNQHKRGLKNAAVMLVEICEKIQSLLSAVRKSLKSLLLD
jgi:hypothetical protein